MASQQWLSKVISVVAFMFIFGVFSEAVEVDAMHYRGGTISWTPGPNYNSSYKEVSFSFRLSWKHSHIGCDDDTIASGAVIGKSNQQWLCSHGCSGPVGPTAIRCSEYSEEKDYTNGYNAFSHVFTGDGPFEISYMYCCWAATVSTDETSQWSLTTRIDLGRRSDTSRPNSAPIVTSPLAISFEPGVPAIYQLEVVDGDSDVTRCRLGRHLGECGNACDVHNEFVFDQENCRLIYQPRFNTTGLFPFSFVVEDFAGGDAPIVVGDRRLGINEPLSSVPFQFTIDVGSNRHSANSCNNIKPTLKLRRNNGGAQVIRTNRLLEVTVEAETCSEDERIRDFQLSGPSGTSRSDVTMNEEGNAQVVLSWQPTDEQEGLYTFCANATQTDGLKSNEACMNVFVDRGLFFCRGSGGSQHITFDGYQYSFMGGCRYQLAVTTFQPLETIQNDLQPFNITVLNYEDGGDGRPSINAIFITIAGRSIELHRNKRIIVDGARVHPPVRLPGVDLDLSGRFIVMTTESGATLRFDGYLTYVIGLPYQYRDHVKGLCGNFNGNIDDDRRVEGITRVMSPAEIASYYQIDGSRCTKAPVIKESRCSNGRRMLSNHVCGMMTQRGGCFDDCHSFVDPQGYFQSCTAALCTSSFTAGTLDAQVGMYADACQLEGAAICDWRRRIGTALECAPNSHYEQCGPSSPRTCHDLNEEPSQPSACVEGCQCDDGFVLSGGNCVPQSLCGCFVQGSYRLPGFTYRTGGCSQECRCDGGNNTICAPAPPCGDDERCGMLESGVLGCVPRSDNSATCKIFGDPHYETFDGLAYDSMSTCAHILVRSRAGSLIAPFIVVGVNEQPLPNNTASHVKEVQVSVGGTYNLNVTLSQGPVVKLNGLEIHPGSSFRGVQFRMTAQFIVVTFEFGLVLRWDGVDRLRITAWGPLSGQVEGLCGNFDADASNDLAASNGGGLITDVATFIRSWRVSGLDLAGNTFPEPPTNATSRCIAEGYTTPRGVALCIQQLGSLQGSCRERLDGENLFARNPCLGSGQEEYRDDCYILKDPIGPFASCHAFFDPTVAYDNCLFDMCVYKGNETIKESIIASYDYDCRVRNVSTAWRDAANTPMVCGDNSNPHACLSQCEPSCDDPEGRRCKENLDMDDFCEEGCRCDEGFVRSNAGGCVPTDTCGCILNGLYQQKGFTFRRNNCSEECECVGDGEVTCRPTQKCSIGLTCGDDSLGFERCLGRLRRRATCKAVTDPHYMTFDGTTYDSMGTCAYIMVQNRRGASVPNFQVIAVNENPLPHQIVSHVRDVHVRFGDNKTLSFYQGPRVTLDGVEIQPGTEMDGFKLRMAGTFVVAEFDFRLVIRWDGEDRLRVTAWQPLRNMVEGLCGDFDDDSSNDWQTSWGEVTTDLQTFVSSWEVQGYDTEGCVLPPPRNVTEICRNDGNLVRFGQECSVLTDPEGPFANCHEEVDPWPTYRDCIYDLCVYNGSTVRKDRIFTSYIADCESNGRQPNEDWRDIVELPMGCQENMHYNVSAFLCQRTCNDPDASRCMESENVDMEILETEEGCQCNEGYVRSGMKCVPVEECGCMVNGMYFPRGFVQRNEDCSQECECFGNNNMTCYDAPPCPQRSKCKVDEDGYRRCVTRSRRRATCKAVTDPHYMTFDGTRFDSMGMCSYIMVRSKSNATVPPFMVVAVNEQPEPHRIVSHVREVHVHYGANQTMQFGPGKTLKLNGMVVNPGFNRDGIEIRTAGQFTVVDWEFGLVVRWDGEDRVRIVAWSPLRYQVEGVCGDFNDNADDDFKSPNGTLISGIDAFVNSWIIEGYGAEGCQENPAADPMLVPDDCTDEEVMMRHSNSCYVLIDPEGPLKDCQSVVDAHAAYQSCLFDQCTYNGDSAMKDRLISSYLETCLEEDEDTREDNETEPMKPPVWRPVTNLTDPECPPNSHYTLCMAECQRSCDDPDALTCGRNPRVGHACVQGCEADDGYLVSGGVFVPPSHCGCTVGGTYYMDGQYFMTGTCDSRCQCNEGVVTCVEAGCKVNQECRPNSDGALACQPFRTVTCERTGNGHFVTFDNLVYTYKGVCTYTLSAPVENPRAWFVEVDIQTTDMITTRVRAVRYVNNEANLIVTFAQDVDVVRIEVNGVEVANVWSTLHEDTEIQVQRRGRFAILSTSMGKRIEFDGNQLILYLPIYLKDQVTGLCGNFNGLPEDDVADIGSDDENNIAAFASNFQLRDCDDQPLSSSCTEELYAIGQRQDHCGIISNITGALRSCNRVIRGSITRRFHQQCVDDFCSSGGNRTVLQQSVESYAHECLTTGIRICDWREQSGFVTTCPPNMHYDGCASSCPRMCGQTPHSEDCPMLETCVCDDGYILKEGVCVPFADCGCVVDGVSSIYGESFTRSGCDEQCTCHGEDRMTCQPTPGCRANEMCQRGEDEAFSCVRRPPARSTCSVLSGRHFNTFDGSPFDIVVTCSYVLTQANDLIDLPGFSVVATFGLSGFPALSRVTEVIIEFDDHQRTLIMRMDGSIEIDGSPHEPGVPLRGVVVEKVDRFAVVSLPMGLVVRWDFQESLIIDAWRQLNGNIEGMCGNFDDDATNDVTSGDVRTFARMWESMESESCLEEVPAYPPSPCFGEASRICNVLTEGDGPFSLCHDLVSPLSYEANCLFDACADATTRQPEAVIASYARGCRREGGNPDPWRDTANATLTCTENSVYSSCASQCQRTCVDRDGSRCQANELLGDDCEEACLCADGFVKDDGQCIPESQCGCLTPSGTYIEAGASRLVDNCSLICQCLGGILSCSESSCFDDQYCGVRDREYGCHWRDECEYANGGCSHTCETRGGVAVCSCPQGFLLSPDMKKCNKTEDDLQVDCEDGETEREKLARWREATFVEWRSKLQMYVDSFTASFEDPSQMASVCGNSWTEWLDRDNPGGLGDDESLNLLQLEFPRRICRHPVAIEARIADGRPATASGNNVIMSPEVGLRCENEDQPEGVRCADFQVRFLCLGTLV